jgi:hypothetical protein
MSQDIPHVLTNQKTAKISCLKGSWLRELDNVRTFEWGI